MARKESPGFMLYHERQGLADFLPDDSAGRLLKAMFSYSVTGELLELSDVEMAVFLTFKSDIDRSKKKYDEICERNRKNGEKGGRPKKDEDLPFPENE